jgi:hypothetical protein
MTLVSSGISPREKPARHRLDPASDPKSVDKLIKDFDLNDAICVDEPGGEAWGTLLPPSR